ncbi:VanW family protein [Demequina flava]|uniref:VanW family protein n=1 Tax=Demequina flava TaxID=1095025 RepID=UPI001364B79F|nr:VanW family protein [Demequina flava]
MSRRKDLDRAAAEQELQRRRNSAAHRSLRKRAERGAGAHSAVAAPRVTADTPQVPTERTPTSELVAPTWLAPDAAAAGLPDDTAEEISNDDSGNAERVSFVAAAAAAKFASSRPSAASAEAADPMEGVEATGEEVVDPPAEDATEVMPAVEPDPTPAPEAPSSIPPVPPATAQEDAPVSDAPKRKRKGRGWLVTLVLLLVLAGAYVGAAALLSNTVPRGTTAMGVEIGGMSTGQAVAALDDEVETVGAQEITVTVANVEGQVTGTEAGMGVDTQATVEQTIGFTLEPARMWERFAGGGELEVEKTTDADAMVAAMSGLSGQMNREPADATVEIVGTSAIASPGQTGVTLDEDATGAVVAQAWPESFEVEGVADVNEATISDGTAENFADEVTTVAFSGPVTLVADAGEVTLTPEEIAEMSTVVQHGGTLALEVDGVPLAESLREANPDLITEPKDAELSFTSDQKVDATEGVEGQDIDDAALGEAIVEAAYSATRSGDLPVEVTEPEVTSESLGIEDLKEVVATFDTPLTNEAIRTQNLITAAADVEGTVILPGEQFNLAETLAPITVAEGYGEAHVIVDGVLTNGVGGGLSQMATTTYNVGYFAGFDLIQHRPHSVWFTRYPAGRESTLWGTTINVIFENNTPYAAVMNSYVSGGRLYVDMWSTPHFDVETYASDKTNVRSPGVQEVDNANCEAKGPGQDGFTITNTRKVFLDGEQVDENVDTWTYEPDDAIKCVSDDDEDDD